jgi:hypothetical protein
MFLEFRDNSTAHEDLFFTFNGRVRTCDSYYFRLDRNLDPDEEGPEKAKNVLKRLLEQWLEFVEDSWSGEIVFLPYDFSDQYIGCLRCEVQNASVSLTDGYLEIPGASIYPSDIEDLVKSKSYFTVTDKSLVLMQKADLALELRTNINTT